MTRSRQVLLIAAASWIGAGAYVAGYFPWRAPGMVAAAEPARTVSWYRQHQTDLKKELATCNDNPGSAMTDPDCQNAAEAKSQLDIEEFQGKPPSHK